MDQRRARAEVRIGTRVHGKFVLERLLGVGGMAAVYEARHRNGGRVALKILHASLDASLQQRKRFLREAYAANTIGHAGAVRIFDDGVDDSGTVYLVMELLEGETLADRQQRGPVPLPQLLSIADQLLDVLAAAHERGVVHRDIKPANLFVTRQGELKVLDFGIARLIENVAGSTLETQPGTTLGTPGFMPQEQARGRWDEVDARSDIWAIGATLFTLASGEHVHLGDTPNERYGRAMTMPARSLGAVAPELPEGLVQIVDRALRFERAERWPDARSMQAALRALDGSVDIPSFAGALVDESALAMPTTEAASSERAILPPSVSTFMMRSRVSNRAIAIAIGALLLAFAVPLGLRALGTREPEAQASVKLDSQPGPIDAPQSAPSLSLAPLEATLAASEPEIEIATPPSIATEHAAPRTTPVATPRRPTREPAKDAARAPIDPLDLRR